MRVRRISDDLTVVLGITLLVPIIMFMPVFRDTSLRFIIGVPFVLFVPGYALVSALYPMGTNSNESGTENGSGNTSIMPLERTALSFVFSMALVSIVGFILNSTPFGLRLVPVLVTLCVIVVVLIGIANRRRQALAPEKRFVVPWWQKVQSVRAELFEPDSKTTAALNILLFLSILVAIISAGSVIMSPAEGEASTEFYILTEEEELAVGDYPTEFVVGESKSLIVGIENQEYQTMRYTVLVDLHRTQVQNNSTQITESERLRSFEAQIEHNETWEKNHTLTPQMTGKQLRLTYRLYRGDPPASPTAENAYRNLRLIVDVTSADQQ